MSDDSLVTEIVSNEKLGIGKKPSIFKLIFIVLFLLVLGFLGYSFFLKAQPDEVQPQLDLGAPLPQTQPITPSQVVPVVAGEVESQTPVTFQETAQGMPQADPQPSMPAQLPDTATTLAAPNITTAQAGTATTVVANNSTSPVGLNIAPEEINKSVSMAPINQSSLDKLTAVVTKTAPVTSTESALLPSETVVKPPVKKVKKVVRKKAPPQPKQEVVEATPVQAIPVEEGVTREEIIVIQ